MSHAPFATRSTIYLLVLTSLLLAVLGCTLDIGGPEAPGPPIPIDRTAGDQVKQSWQSAIAGAALDGQVRVILNETQLTGFLAERFEGDGNPLLSSPQVYLRQGEIQIYGIAQRAMVSGSILVAVRPELTEQGEIRFEIPQAKIGPIPAPSALRGTISSLLTEAFTGSIGSLATGVRITSLVISDGEMAIVGELR